ncbi:MAG TPA: hypothetical protein VGG75_05630 [Trebonia sp.]|jgi:hypothetical protein
MTAVTDEIGAAFESALVKDAGAAGGAQDAPEMDPPPERDPKAPHGRDGDGQPLAPFGLKTDGTPRLRPAGPGRPKGDDKPRVAAVTQTDSTGKGSGDADYSDDLMALGTQAWLALSMVRGGKFGPVKLPDARPFAAVWHEELPNGVVAWNEAAKQSPAVREWIGKFSGEGSMTWTVGVGMWAFGLVAACTELAKAPADVREKAAAANDATVKKWFGKQVEAMGVAA